MASKRPFLFEENGLSAGVHVKTGSDIDKFVGNRVSQQRGLALLSLEEAAAITKISVDDLRAIETGAKRATGDQIISIAAGFSCVPSDFFPPAKQDS